MSAVNYRTPMATGIVNGLLIFPVPEVVAGIIGPLVGFTCPQVIIAGLLASVAAGWGLAVHLSDQE